MLLCECKTWATTKYLRSHLDAFATWALHKIFRIPYTRHVSNVEVRGTTGCSPLSHLVTNRRLQLFGHIAHNSRHDDHDRALAVAIQVPQGSWPSSRSGYPSTAQLEAAKRKTQPHLAPCNWGRPGPPNFFGLTTAWSKATIRDDWWHIVDTAMLERSVLLKTERKG